MDNDIMHLTSNYARAMNGCWHDWCMIIKLKARLLLLEVLASHERDDQCWLRNALTSYDELSNEKGFKSLRLTFLLLFDEHT